MNAESTILSEQYQQPAYQLILKGHYTQAASRYEQAISVEPEVKSHYWYLGLTMLLQEQEAEAQTTWLLGMMDGEPAEIEQWTQDLKSVLQQEAIRQESLEKYSTAWTIRQQIRELGQSELEDLLPLVQLAIKLEKYTGEELNEYGILECLCQPESIDWKQLMAVLKSVLEFAPLHPSTLELAEVAAKLVQNSDQALKFINVTLRASVEIAFSYNHAELAAKLGELCLRLDPKGSETTRHLAGFYQNSGNYEKGIETALLHYSLQETLTEKINANHLIIRGLMVAGGRWEEAVLCLQEQQSLLFSLVELHPLDLDEITISRLINTNYFFNYFQDNPRQFRFIQDSVAKIFQENIAIHIKEPVERYRQRHQERQKLGETPKVLKIGYVSHCMRNHSVGWLARWLLQYHDRSRFQLYGYFVACEPIYDPLHDWYLSQFSQAYKFKTVRETAEQIYQDEIDILIELDSITLDMTCEVMAQKPAPIQVSWLGWDASGIPNIDYYFADPYVLPESAQEYYTEKIWRLPETYIAVDGFELTVPTRRREDLEIDNNAVVYLSSQRGMKRHPETARLQLEIIKEVPNSYFLIKGDGDGDLIKRFFLKVAEEVGVESDRLRFLTQDSSEAIHRANLGIADVVLDTFPYNGATTTLEALWVGVPLVTLVGEQFAARNSYTMLVNAGISEGIAWSPEEYVQWGIRFGKDEALRQTVAWKLKRSRQTAPLWNAKAFTHQVEDAYQQMWQKFIEPGKTP